ncbi:MAG: ABC transporter permease [Methanomicrobiales archaeon]|nr:ABC transporter permease [Methanomicrobiales archaeon]
MRSKGLFVIAEKEFMDHIYSRKFLMILSIILIVAIIGMITGSAEYNQQIEDYNENQAEAVDTGGFTGFMGFKPSLMTIFGSVGDLLMSLGAILGIAMGFDLITREKESKSLKILLSHPIYRDEVINGKAIGGISALFVALLVTGLIAVAILLIFGIVPSGDELFPILLFGIAAFLMIFSYFAIALFMSTVSEDSGNSLIYTLIVFIFLSILLPVFVADTTIDIIVGEAPEYPEELMEEFRGSMRAGGGAPGMDRSALENNEAWVQYRAEMQDYWNKRQSVSDFITLLSPTSNFEHITDSLSGGGPDTMRTREGAFTYADTGDETAGPLDILGSLAKNLVALIVVPALFFGLAYVRFMRLDVR